MIATDKDHHDALRQHSPKIVANMEAIVAQGIPRAEAFAKFREFTPNAAEVPEFLWETIERTYDYLVKKRAAGAGRN